MSDPFFIGWLVVGGAIGTLYIHYSRLGHGWREWADRRRRARDWRLVRKWNRQCVWRFEGQGSGNIAGHVIILGWENGLGQRRIEMLESSLPSKDWGNPKQRSDWAEALDWKHEVRAPVNTPRLRVVR